MLRTGEIAVMEVAPWALNCRCPAVQLILVSLAPVPAKTRATNWAVDPCEMHEFTRYGGAVTAPTEASGQQAVVGSVVQLDDGPPSTILVTTGCTKIGRGL